MLKEIHLKKLSPNEVKAPAEIEVLKPAAVSIALSTRSRSKEIIGLVMEHAPAGSLDTAIKSESKTATSSSQVADYSAMRAARGGAQPLP